MAAFFHRKILQKSMKPRVIIREEYCSDDSSKLPPLSTLLPPPPPSSTLSSNHPLSLYLIILFCGLAVSFSFICYLTLSTIHRRRQRNHENMDEIHEEFVNEDHGPVLHHHPIWLINTIGLDQSQIDSIHVVKYKKDEGLIEGTDCSVCLSEFEDDESLRLLPKCSHAFHVPCIDTWLRSHKNCPLCRAPIIKNTTDNQTDHHATIEMNSIESSTSDETEGEDSEAIEHHVVEVENNGEMEKTSGVRVQSDLADRHRVQEQEIVATRRSVSMDEFSASIVHFAVARHSSRQLVVSKRPMVNSIPKGGHKLKGSTSSISIRSRLMKSSSIGHSSRKATSLTKRSYSSSGKGSHNRSY